MDCFKPNVSVGQERNADTSDDLIEDDFRGYQVSFIAGTFSRIQLVTNQTVKTKVLIGYLGKPWQIRQISTERIEAFSSCAEQGKPDLPISGINIASASSSTHRSPGLTVAGLTISGGAHPISVSQVCRVYVVDTPSVSVPGGLVEMVHGPMLAGDL